MRNKRCLAERPCRNGILYLFSGIILWAVLVSQGECCDKENFTVFIDIGHSRRNSGAMSARGTGEYDFNKTIAELLLSTLQENGFSNAVIINRNGVDINLNSRVEIANRVKGSLLISIQHDSVQPQYISKWIYKGKMYSYSDEYSGYSIFYSDKNVQHRESLHFAKLLGEEMLKHGFTPTLHHAEKIKGENRELVDQKKGIYKFDDLVILKQTRIPAILLECGIIVNRQEELKLRDLAIQSKIVAAIMKSIIAFCGSDIGKG